MTNASLLGRISTVLLLVMIYSTFSYAADSYKCKGHGKFDSVVWQDVPCRAGEEISRTHLQDYSKQDASKKGHGQLTSANASKLIRHRKITVGMSKRDVIRSWGEPKKTNISLSNQGKSEQLVYYQYANTPVVDMNYLGEVSSINYSKVKKEPTKASPRLGTVRTEGYGAFRAK